MMLWLILMLGAVMALPLVFAEVNTSTRITKRINQLEPPRLEKKGPHPSKRLVGLLERWLSPLGFMRRLEKLLSHERLPWTPGEFLLLCLVAFAVLSGIGWLLTHLVWVAMAFGAVGSYLPFFWLNKRHQKRIAAYNFQLPDAMMLIVNALKGGNGLLQAFHLVEQHMPPPIGSEFLTTILEIKWGIPVETALLNLQERLELVEAELMIRAILIQREAGGNLSEILLNIHDTICDRNRIQGEIKSLTAQGRLSGIILCLMPLVIGFLFYLINPKYISMLFVDPRGKCMLMTSIVLFGIGSLAISKIVKVEY
jgi:tight adherence protein B